MALRDRSSVPASYPSFFRVAGGYRGQGNTAPRDSSVSVANPSSRRSGHRCGSSRNCELRGLPNIVFGDRTLPRDRALYLKIQNNISLRTLMRAIHGSFPLVKETASWSPRSVRVARLLSAMFIVARAMVIASLACFRLPFYETE